MGPTIVGPSTARPIVFWPFRDLPKHRSQVRGLFILPLPRVPKIKDELRI